MSTYHTGSDRTPAWRAVPVLIALGLLLVIAWLLVAIDRQSQPQPQPGAAGRPGPSTLFIPKLGVRVRAAIVGVGLKANGAMQTPDPGQVGWYRHGPKPGDPGPAVLVGHIDNRTGPDVFHRLGRLRRGDEILVGRPDGTTTRFLVGRLERHPKTELPTSRIWTKSNRPLLRLITCAGSFDHATGHYRGNLILYASPA